MNKPFLLNNSEASANDLIETAKNYDAGFGSNGLFTTSRAANILRRNGWRVTHNPAFTPTEEKP